MYKIINIINNLNSVAEGDFSQLFYGGQAQTIRQQKTVINLIAPVQTSLIIAYAMEPNEKKELAFGIEHETSTNETAFSVRMNMEF